MRDTLENPEATQKAARFSRSRGLLAGVVLVALVAILWWTFLKRPAAGKNPTPQINAANMTAAERDYVKNLRLENISLSRAENFLHQEVTTLSADLVNSGSLPVVSLALTFEFSDIQNQIVLRETRPVLGVQSPRLSPGERRSFEISFDHIPASWNMQAPDLRLAYLQLASK